MEEDKEFIRWFEETYSYYQGQCTCSFIRCGYCQDISSYRKARKEEDTLLDSDTH